LAAVSPDSLWPSRHQHCGSVVIVTKKETSESNTNYAQGGNAAVIDQDDSFEEHIRDTIVCGAGLCNEEDVVDFVVREAPSRIQELIDWGVQFTKSGYRLTFMIWSGRRPYPPPRAACQRPYRRKLNGRCMRSFSFEKCPGFRKSSRDRSDHPQRQQRQNHQLLGAYVLDIKKQ
jgi:hypothetical protein